METKDPALELEVIPSDTSTDEGNIVKELRNIDISSSESAILNPSVIKKERSEIRPTVNIKHDSDTDELTIRNPSDVQEESPEGMITVDIVPDSDLEQIPDLNHCPDQGNANISVQFLSRIL